MGRRHLIILATFAGVVACVCASVAEAAASPHRFQTGFLDNQTFTSPLAATGFQRAAEAGATIERLIVDWAAVAPARPAHATDEADPGYRWAALDAEVSAALAAGQEPLANVVSAPSWATSHGGTYPATYPDPQQFADFAYAAAQHFDGVNGPRITFWEIGNEPNLGLFLEPQFVNGRPMSAIWYRDVLNRSVPEIKSVHGDNFVVAGSTAPFYDTTPSTLAVNPAWGPLGFLRAVLCLTPQLTTDTSQPGCPGPVPFDAWSHHPYAEGGPTRQATLADDVELGDLPKLRRVLDAGWAAGAISAAAAPEIWATEFSWNASPPDPGGVPADLMARWIPEAMHAMWSNGVTVLTWFQLVDTPAPYQTGFYVSEAAMLAAQPKPFVQAFRFPFVAYPGVGGITFWGRTPGGTPGTVAVEQADGAGGWTELGQITSDQYGIVEGGFPTASARDVRARLTATGEPSPAFSLTPVPDQFFPSFGRYQFEPSPPPPPPAPAPPSGGGGGGGGGGGLAADMTVHGSVSSPTANPGDTLVWTFKVDDANTGPAVDVFLDLTLSPNLTYVSSTTTRGPACGLSGAKVHCFLDWMSGDAATATITVTTTVAAAGAYSVGATVGQLIPDSNPANNAIMVTASTPPPPAPPTAPPPSHPVKPIIGPPSAAGVPVAGKRFAVSFRVTRSDDRRPAASVKVVITTTVAGAPVAHTTSLVNGGRRVALVIPRRAKAKLLRVKITVILGGQVASRAVTYRIR